MLEAAFGNIKVFVLLKRKEYMFSTIPSVFFETCRKFVMFPLKLFWRKYSITFFFNFAYCTVFFP